MTRTRYPDLEIPYHSRWRHFEAGGVDRKAELDDRLAELDTPARARAMIDLAVVSVLLDAGAGPDWHYLETDSGQRFTRSEGLGVASWHAFLGGLFSSDADAPAAGRRRRHCVAVDGGLLAEAFQISPSNPLVGFEGRVALLQPAGRGAGRAVRSCSARRVGRAGCSTCWSSARAGDRARHPVAAPGVAVGNLAGGQHHRRPAARRLLAPRGRHRRGPDPGLGAVPQAVAVADLLAAGTVRMGRRARRGRGRADRTARIPQRRPAAGHRRAASARPGLGRSAPGR